MFDLMTIIKYIFNGFPIFFQFSVQRSVIASQLKAEVMTASSNHSKMKLIENFRKQK